MAGRNNSEHSRPGTSNPKLCFNNMSRPSWKTLEPQPLGYYVVGTTDDRNSTTMLRLAHENGGIELLVKRIFLEQRAEDRRILVLSDAAIASEMLGTAVMKALTRNGKGTLKPPSNPRGFGEAGPSAPGKPAEIDGGNQERTKPAPPAFRQNSRNNQWRPHYQGFQPGNARKNQDEPDQHESC